MLFNSIEFLVFLPCVAALYFALPRGWRWLLLLVASYVFYMAWNPWYILLIVASTAIDYVAGRAIAATGHPRVRAAWLGASLAVNLGLLFTFKYFNFFSETAAAIAAFMGRPYEAPLLEVLLPVGISFYTFQTLSYTLEVYGNRQEPERNPGRFALYVAFFPQLVAGPIERPQNLLHQLREPHPIGYERVRAGLALALWGLFKKVVIADRLAEVVDTVYAAPGRFLGPATALATVFFAFQIYCDFSGYSDIAIGVARLFGVDLMRNFDRPYLAKSISEFWRRWHISLSAWFRDYVYVPLGGNRSRGARWAVNILLVFGVSGLWHGANWTFVVWGLLHAGFYLAGRAWTALRADTSRPLPLAGVPRRLGVFALVCLAWVFFRAGSIADALTVLRFMPAGWGELAHPGLLPGMAERMGASLPVLAYDCVLIVLLMVAEGRDEERAWVNRVLGRVWWQRWAWYLALGWAVMNLGTIDEIPFIYFQF